MSNPLKAIGKVFKKVVKVVGKIGKVVMKIAPYALAAAAVVFTAGSALGLGLPTFAGAIGGVVSKLGLSVAVSGALTGAITSAGFGAAIGGVLGGKKGLKAGFLAGALTGGVMGALNPASFGIVQGANGTTTMNALTHGGNAFAGGPATTAVNTVNGVSSVGAPIGMAPTGMAPAGAPVAAAAPQAPTGTPSAPGAPQSFGNVPQQPLTVGSTSLGAPAPAGGASFSGLPAAGAPVAAAASGGGGLTGMLSNPMMVSQMLQGVGGMLGKGKEETYEDQAKAKERLGRFAYGGAYDGPDPFGMANVAYSVPQPRYYYDPQSKQVVDRQQQGG